MKKKQDNIFVICLTVLMIVYLTRPAYAYLDPGIYSFIIQVVVGGLIAVAAGVKLYWNKIKSLFSGKK